MEGLRRAEFLGGRRGKRALLGLSLLLLWPISPLPGAVLVLKNGRTWRGRIRLWNEENYLIAREGILVPRKKAAWFSEKEEAGEVIREWWEGIRNRSDLEDAVLPLARFCLQEGRLKEGLRFARLWGSFRKWDAFLSRNFLILTDGKEGRAKLLGKRLDAALDLLAREFPGGKIRPFGCVVRFFSSWKSFSRFALFLPGKPETAYYDPAGRILYLPDTRLKTSRSVFPDAYRETCSYFLQECLLGFVPRRIWILVGTSLCFSTAKWEKGRLKGAWGKIPDYVERIRVAMKSGTGVPLGRFFRATQKDFILGDAYKMFYAQSWAFVWFLHESRDPAHRQAYFRYLEILRRSKDEEKALREAFPPARLGRLERAWKAFFGVKPRAAGRR